MKHAHDMFNAEGWNTNVTSFTRLSNVLDRESRLLRFLIVWCSLISSSVLSLILYRVLSILSSWSSWHLFRVRFESSFHELIGLVDSSNRPRDHHERKGLVSVVLDDFRAVLIEDALPNWVGTSSILVGKQDLAGKAPWCFLEKSNIQEHYTFRSNCSLSVFSPIALLLTVTHRRRFGTYLPRFINSSRLFISLLRVRVILGEGCYQAMQCCRCRHLPTKWTQDQRRSVHISCLTLTNAMNNASRPVVLINVQKKAVYEDDADVLHTVWPSITFLDFLSSETESTEDGETDEHGYTLLCLLHLLFSFRSSDASRRNDILAIFTWFSNLKQRRMCLHFVLLEKKLCPSVNDFHSPFPT